MMQEQVEQVRAETKAVRQSVERAERMLEGLAQSENRQNQGVLDVKDEEPKRKNRVESSDKRVWEILHQETGHV